MQALGKAGVARGWCSPVGVLLAYVPPWCFHAVRLCL